MKITMKREISINATTEQYRKVGGRYNMCPSEGFQGISWGTVEVLEITKGMDIPSTEGNQIMDWISGLGLDNHEIKTERQELEQDLWIKYAYTWLIGVDEKPEQESLWIPADVFVAHTLSR